MSAAWQETRLRPHGWPRCPRRPLLAARLTSHPPRRGLSGPPSHRLRRFRPTVGASLGVYERTSYKPLLFVFLFPAFSMSIVPRREVWCILEELVGRLTQT